MRPAKRWAYRENLSDFSVPGLSPLDCLILARRGVRDAVQAQAFLGRGYAASTNPFDLLDMDRAVERLRRAHQLGERVVVYGDYDADGVTATVLLFEWLKQAGFTASWYIPDRFQEGYGLHAEALAGLREEGASVVVTVDCGVRSIREVEQGGALGLDLIVTDHHLPGEALPAATAVLNPKRPGDPYPFKGLSGVGLAYKLVEGLAGSLQGPPPQEMLDLVAVGTVADLAPLLGENRALVSAGLERLNDTRRVGLLALIETSGFSRGALSASSIAFGLAPRLNAAGRLASARLAAELLLTEEAQTARAYAERLDALNRERQRITEQTVELVKASTELGGDRMLVFAAHAEFHEGVVGLAASRIVEEIYRPVLLMRLEGEWAKGSARSIPEFDVTRALESCAELLQRFGGHELAAGFALPVENLQALGDRLELLALESLGGVLLQPRLELDARVEFSELDERLMRFLDRLEPCGQENPYPAFAAQGVEVLSRRAVGAEGRHLKLTLRQSGRVFDAIAFRQGGLLADLPAVVEVAFRLERNEFRGVTSLQLNVLDIRPSGEPRQ
ncbi:MAG TPA: single-stranded-DNA-specific exonuclease RecJ [Anaerolineales bacterium]